MKLCIYDYGRLGVVRDGAIFDATAALEHLPAWRYGVRDGDPLIEALPDLRSKIEVAAARSAPVALSDVALKAPVVWPGKLVGAPVNYNDHLAEAQADPSVFTAAQVTRIHEIGLFLKATSSLVGCSEGITVGKADRRTDHEVELAVIIGRTASKVGREKALDYVAGYAIGLDITVRGPEERSMRKSIDSYSVLGPWMVTADEIDDPGNLDFSLKVNGEVRQSANTRDLVIDVPGLIEMASSWYTLQPGDVIYTGTPAGVGPIAPGDLITATVQKIGTMEVAVRGG
ncbi:MAG: fumarylacetoacetate hydrolase family protein [Sphingomonadaceae bacterium]